jgi:predicted metal-dependent RNase
MLKDDNIRKTMEWKEKSISGFQRTKEDSIRLAGASRDATQIVITYPELLENKELRKQIQEEWNYWRDWFMEESAEKRTETIKQAKDDEVPF